MLNQIIRTLKKCFISTDFWKYVIVKIFFLFYLHFRQIQRSTSSEAISFFSLLFETVAFSCCSTAPLSWFDTTIVWSLSGLNIITATTKYRYYQDRQQILVTIVESKNRAKLQQCNGIQKVAELQQQLIGWQPLEKEALWQTSVFLLFFSWSCTNIWHAYV